MFKSTDFPSKNLNTLFAVKNSNYERCDLQLLFWNCLNFFYLESGGPFGGLGLPLIIHREEVYVTPRGIPGLHLIFYLHLPSCNIHSMLWMYFMTVGISEGVVNLVPNRCIILVSMSALINMGVMAILDQIAHAIFVHGYWTRSSSNLVLLKSIEPE